MYVYHVPILESINNQELHSWEESSSTAYVVALALWRATIPGGSRSACFMLFHLS
jgi:hypothetical protein